MELKDFVQNIAAQFDETDTSVFAADTKFRDFEEWSSLTALSIIAMIDEKYHVTFQGDDIRNSSSINDLFEIVKSRMG
nr:phosphopantetheine-binding protein [uncultured Macellibacteroides sp.]